MNNDEKRISITTPNHSFDVNDFIETYAKPTIESLYNKKTVDLGAEALKLSKVGDKIMPPSKAQIKDRIKNNKTYIDGDMVSLKEIDHMYLAKLYNEMKKNGDGNGSNWE